jgi:hypothetical protein
MKRNFEMRSTSALLERDNGPGVAATKQEKAEWEEMINDERLYLLGQLDDAVLGDLIRSPWTPTYTIKQTWDAIRKEILGMSEEEKHALLISFHKLKEAIYPSPDAFFETIDERCDHLNKYFSQSLPVILKFSVALEGTQNSNWVLYTGFWRNQKKTSQPTFERLRDYVQKEVELERPVFNATDKPKGLKAMFRNMAKSKSH